jgi:hypothetical protein
MTRKWKLLTERELRALWKGFRKYYGKDLTTFIFFLGTGTEDFKIKRGEVFARIKDKI